jgi:hypothetical protein
MEQGCINARWKSPHRTLERPARPLHPHIGQLCALSTLNAVGPFARREASEPAGDIILGPEPLLRFVGTTRSNRRILNDRRS